LHRRGALIGDADILIAATALVEGLVLLTNNERHFGRVAGLQIANWLRSAGG
jgi:tRNA(fMet)-specific endonuclease VapC